MVNPARLLGFAFANADLLFEVDAKGTIVFATGAASEFTPEPALVGRSAGALFEAEAAGKFATYVTGLGHGGRAGPLTVKLASGGQAILSLCHLPLNGGNISCTLQRPGAKTSLGGNGKDARTGLADCDAFIATAGKIAEPTDTFSVVEVPGLPEAVAQLPAVEANSLLQSIGATIQALGAKVSGRLSGTAFGTISSIGVRDLLAQAVRQALEEGDLGAAFESMMRDTEARTLKLTGTVAEGSFELVSSLS